MNLKSYFKIYFILLMLITSLESFAAGRGGGKGGLMFDAAIGFPSVTITNPDSSEAGYEGLSVQGRLFQPIYEESGAMGFLIHGTLKYHDLENAASSSNESEVANHIGAGVGITITLKKLYLGYEMMFMKARHYYIGNVGIKTEYNYDVGNLFVGLKYPFGALSLGLSYGMSTGSISKDDTGLSKDSEYNEQTLWLHMTYSTGAGIADFAKELVK